MSGWVAGFSGKHLMKHLVRTIIWVAITVWLSTFVLLRVPAVQAFLASTASEALAAKLGTKVEVGRVDLRLFNRVIIDNLLIYDQESRQMLRAGRVSATIQLLPLLDGKVSISSAQLFGMKASLCRRDASSPLNCQFAIDSLKSKDTTATTPLNLDIASLIIRNGSITYDQHDKPIVEGQFSPCHINISKLSSHIILYKLTDDSLHLSLKRLSLSEASGIRLSNLSADLKATSGDLRLSDLFLRLPNTRVSIPGVRVTYQTDSSGLCPGSLRFRGSVRAEKLSITDFAPLLPKGNLSALPTLKFAATAEGTDHLATATLAAYSTHGAELSLQASATITDILRQPKADILLNRLNMTESLSLAIASLPGMPAVLGRIGSIEARGRFGWKGTRHFTAHTDISTSKAGKVALNGEYNAGSIKATIETAALDIAQLTGDQRFGNIKCRLAMEAHTDGKAGITSGKAKGTVEEMAYRGYTYSNANIDIAYAGDIVSGSLDIQDPNLRLSIDGKAGIGRKKGLRAHATLSDFCPSALNLTDKFHGDHFALTMEADAEGTTIDDFSGTVSLTDISVFDPMGGKPDAGLENATLSVGRTEDGRKQLLFSSDFATLQLLGTFTASTVARSFTNLAAAHLPAIKQLPLPQNNSDDFTLHATIHNTDFIKRLAQLPATIHSPLTVDGYVNTPTGSASITLSAPSLTIGDTSLSATDLRLWTEEDALRARLATNIEEKNGPVAFGIDCRAQDNGLTTAISWDNMRADIFRGRLNTVTQFTPSTGSATDASVSIPHSIFEVGDTVWNIHTRGIRYEDGKLTVDHLAVENDSQHLYVSGTASPSSADTLTVELKDLNIGYILDLVNFHSVEFDGKASGTAAASGVMQHPEASAALTISDFKFEGGRLGTMRLNAGYAASTGNITVEGKAETDSGSLAVGGYISPQHNNIDLAMDLGRTPLEFMRTYCGSFLSDISLHGSGALRLHGPLNAINLEGKVAAKGSMTLTATNCRYRLEGDTVAFIPDDIRLDGVRLHDTSGGVAHLTGGIHHRHLSRISYDITATTRNLIAYNIPTLSADDTFCGYAAINGDIGVHGKGNEVRVTADCTLLPNSFLTYNASSPETLRSQDFITWGSHQATLSSPGTAADTLAPSHRKRLDAGNDRANIRLDLMVNTTPETRLHVIMDEATGDNIDLYGSGALRIDDYNKGVLNIFGNYTVDHGSYRMTVQNLMRRDFSFRQGGTIAFSGDPYDAILNLQAAYHIPSVPLADLRLGSSFKANSVPVSCLMNITGPPANPRVDFGLDLPSLGSDARQMVYSVINSEEEMNQQVLYLLAIGRFYSQDTDGDGEQRTNRGTLAMQSFLSGTLSQQLTDILGQVTGSTNWTLGANITPGADGFNNAVYEGLLSGRLFNNRLVFNGQFGYRDNISTDTQNFIGDFTLQYLLTPTGSFALKMYNQSNDRYFTRSSLNTQGIGIVIQKEFGRYKSKTTP